LSGAGDIGQVISACRLVAGKCDLDFTGGNLRQQLLLHRIRCSVANQSAASHDGAQVRLQQQPLTELFHDQHDIDGIAAEAAVIFRQRQRQQPQFRELAPGFRGKPQARC
jgi:hypothetical protein